MSKSERNALTILVAIVVLGIGTRSWRAYCGTASAGASGSNTGALRQIEAVDSVRDAGGRSTTGRGGRGGVGGGRGAGGGGGGRGSRGRGQPKAAIAPAAPILPFRGKLDVDTATVEQLEQILGLGPTLAGRIVTDRIGHGAFGCLAQLRLVQGVGPAVMRRIDSLVTFSGLPRSTGPCQR